MNASQLVESYKFWDVVSLWSRERLEHELIVARALARGVIIDGLRLHSADPKWVSAGPLAHRLSLCRLLREG
jgi:hypothetical protein